MMVPGTADPVLRKVIMDDPLARLPAAYRVQLTGLLDRTVGDPRIRAVWLSGSLARGTADAGSDLDLIITVTDEALPAIRAGWRDWWGNLTIKLVDSKADARVQLADLLAGIGRVVAESALRGLEIHPTRRNARRLVHPMSIRRDSRS